jgi:hypothetical protein
MGSIPEAFSPRKLMMLVRQRIRQHHYALLTENSIFTTDGFLGAAPFKNLLYNNDCSRTFTNRAVNLAACTALKGIVCPSAVAGLRIPKSALTLCGCAF